MCSPMAPLTAAHGLAATWRTVEAAFGAPESPARWSRGVRWSPSSSATAPPTLPRGARKRYGPLLVLSRCDARARGHAPALAVRDVVRFRGALRGGDRRHGRRRARGPPRSGPPVTTIRIGTRGSKLALTQTGLVADRLRAAHPGLDIGSYDRDSRRPRPVDTALIGEKAPLVYHGHPHALSAGEVDLAIQAKKDLPTKRPKAGYAACPTSRGPRDAWSSGTRGDCTNSPRIVVGSSSPRREAQVAKSAGR